MSSHPTRAQRSACRVRSTPKAPALGLLSLLAVSWTPLAKGETFWTGNTNSNWQTSSNWSGGLPAAGVDARIGNGQTVNLSSGIAAASGLTLRGSSILNVAAGANLTSSRGNIGFVESGTLNVSGVGTVVTFSSDNLVDLVLGTVAGSVGILTIDNGALVRTGNSFSHDTFLGNNGGTGKLYLNATGTSRGALETNRIAKGSGTIEFNGGILRANSSNNDFLSSFAAGEVTINNGGGILR